MANPSPGLLVPSGSLVSPSGGASIVGPLQVSGDTGNLLTTGSDGYISLPSRTIYGIRQKTYNAIRNPEALVIQRGAGPTASGGYSTDGWLIGGGLAGVTWSQILVDIPADTSGNNWYPHIQYAYRITFGTGKPSLAATDAVVAYQYVEGNLSSPLKDNPTSISLLARATIPGTFAVALRDGPGAYSYVTTATIVAANTWIRTPLPNIPTFPAAGSFPSGTAHCHDLLICPVMGVGHVNSAPTLNSWISGNYWGTGTATNFAATSNNTFDFTIVQHEPNSICTPYVRRSLEQETALCQRYLCYPNYGPYLGWVHDGNWTYEMGRVVFPSMMRVAPALTAGCSFTVSSGNAGTPSINAQTTTCAQVYNSGAAWTVNAWVIFNGGFTAEL